VLLAMGQPEDVARGSLRFSLGHTSTREEVDRLVAVLPGAVERARAAAGLLSPGAR
jgi:cysteine desulfurase